MTRNFARDELRRTTPATRMRLMFAVLVLAGAAVSIGLLWTAAWVRTTAPQHVVAVVASLLIAGVAWFLLDLLADEVIRAGFEHLYRHFPWAQPILERRLGGAALLFVLVSVMAALFIWIVLRLA